jgi:hypothetical protein
MHYAIGAIRFTSRSRKRVESNQIICDRPSYNEQPSSRFLAEILSVRLHEVEAELIAFTHSKNQWLVANSLLCLDLARSKSVLAEYDRLHTDTRNVSLSHYSFGHQLSLGAIMRRLKAKYAENSDPSSGLAFINEK